MNHWFAQAWFKSVRDCFLEVFEDMPNVLRLDTTSIELKDLQLFAKEWMLQG